MPGRLRSQPWWVEGGLLLCPVCHQRYAYPMQRYCASCDSAMCPICALTEHGLEIHCGDCQDRAVHSREAGARE